MKLIGTVVVWALLITASCAQAEPRLDVERKEGERAGLDSAVDTQLREVKVEHKGIAGIEKDSNGDNYVLLISPRLTQIYSSYAKSGAAGMATQSKEVVFSGSMGRVYPNNDLLLTGGAGVDVNKLWLMKTPSLLVQSDGQKMAVGDGESIVVTSRIKPTTSAKYLPGEDDGTLYEVLPQNKSFSCSGGYLSANGTRVPGGVATYTVRGACWDTKIEIMCSGENLYVYASEVFNGCSGFFK